MLALVIIGIPALLVMGLQESLDEPDMRDQLPDMRREFGAIVQAIGEAPASKPYELAKSGNVSIGVSFTPGDRLAFTRAVFQAATTLQYRAARPSRGELIPEPDLMLLMCSGTPQGRVLQVHEAGAAVAVSLYASPGWSRRCDG